MTLDPATFDTLYAAHAPAIYRSALGIVRDPDAAADVVQETFVRAYTADDEIVSPAAWLGTVARRLALNELRRRGRLTGLVEDAADDDEPTGATLVESAVWADPAKSAASADSVAVAAACLAELRPDDRTLLTVRYGEGLEIGAIAGLLGRTVNATTVALHRARARFDAVYAERVFRRAGIPDSCRPWRADAFAHADGKPASAEYLRHLAACAPCQETDADLRSRSKAFAFAPLLGLPLAVPATLKATVIAGLAGKGIAVGAAGAGGVAVAAGTTPVAAVGGGSTVAGSAAVATGITAKVAIIAIAGVIGVAGLSASVGPMLLAKASSGTFTPTGSMTTGRYFHTATLLPNGLVLIAGGDNSAELYDPASGTFTPTGTMVDARSNHTATMLPNGLVLIAGGDLGASWERDASAELYDPASGTFAPTGTMVAERNRHTATLLLDGRVLIVDGVARRPDAANPTVAPEVASAELYDPASGAFAPTGAPTAPRDFHTATLLSDGRVLIVGGQGETALNAADPNRSIASAELYDPASGIFTPTGSMTTGRFWHTATLLPDGRVLIAGGVGSLLDLVGAELYDPASGTFAPTGTMVDERDNHTATLLPDGRVLIAGGVGNDMVGSHPVGSRALATAELYDPASGTFTPTGDMTAGCWGRSAILLRNGRVLSAGGWNGSGGALASAELFQ